MKRSFAFVWTIAVLILGGVSLLFPLKDARAETVLQGQVTNRETGVPISGVAVKPHPSSPALATTDSNGMYSIQSDQVSSVNLQLYFVKAGYFVSSNGTVLDSPFPNTLNMTLLQAATPIIQGTIRNAATNQPINGAAVTLQLSLNGILGTNATTDINGFYSFDASSFSESVLGEAQAGDRVASIQPSASGFLSEFDQAPFLLPFPVTLNADLICASTCVQYTLTTGASPSSGGTITAGGVFLEGTSVTITATPNTGFRFTGFSGDLSGTANPQTVVMNGPKTVTANFALAVPTPDITVNPLSVNFGTIPLGSTSSELIVTIRNDGQANLNVGVISIVGTDALQFQQFQDRCSSLTLAPTGSCIVSVRFKPTSTGAKIATLRIPSNDPDENPVDVSLNGGAGSATLAPDIDAAPSSLNFGNVRVKGKADQTLTISNVGTARLNIGQITLGGANANQFSIVADKCSLKPLDPTKFCTVGIRFAPTSVNAKNALVIIPSNDPDENPLNVSVTGTGTP